MFNLIFALIIGFLASAILSVATPALAGKRDNSIRYAEEESLDNADPYFNTNRSGVILSHQVWDTLIYRDPKTGEYRGQLATAWKWIDDKTIDFDLRRGVKFHNGAEFDADDVAYTYNFVSKPENKAANPQAVSWIDHVEKLDRYKVRFHTREPFPAAFEFLSGRLGIHPHEYYAKVGPAGMNERPIGTGPYRVVEHSLGKYMRLVRNADYFKDSQKPQPKIEKVEIRFIPDRQTQVAEILSGGVDFIRNVSFDEAQQLRAVPNLQVAAGEIMRYDFLQMDTTERTLAPQLRDIRVRKAIMHAIDRPSMLKQLVGADARVVHVPCFPSQLGCSDADAPRYAYDPAKAKQLLAEAGYPNGFAIDIYGYTRRTHVEAMIGYLRAVGIRANLRYNSYPAHRDAVRAGKVPLAVQSWGSTSINDVSAGVSVFHKFASDDLNRDPEIRDLLVRGDTSMDGAVRKEAYGKALALIAGRAYVLPLFTIPAYFVATKDLSFTLYTDEIPRFWEMSWK